MPQDRTALRRQLEQNADMLSVTAVARRLSISETEVKRKIHSGEIPAYRDGRRWLIPRRLFERYVRDREQQAEAETARRRQGPMRDLITGYSRTKHARQAT